MYIFVNKKIIAAYCVVAAVILAVGVFYPRLEKVLEAGVFVIILIVLAITYWPKKKEKHFGDFIENDDEDQVR